MMKRVWASLVLIIVLLPSLAQAAYQAVGKAEDAAHADGDYGVMSLCVRKDTSTTGIGVNGDYVPCAVNASGYLYTTADVTAVVPGTGASSLGKAEDAVHGSGDTGVFVMGRRIDTAAASSTTSGDYEAFNMDSLGRLWVNDGTIGVEDAAETAGGNLSMAGTVRRDTAASSAGATGDNATLNTDATGRLWSNTELPDAAALADDTANPTVPGIAAFMMCWDGATWDRCVAANNYVEDAASAGGEQLNMVGAVRQDTIASNTSLDGDYTYLKVTSAGRLYTSATIDAALPAGNNNIGDVDAVQSGTWTVQPGNTANTTPWLTTISQGGNAAVVNGSGQLSITCANCSGSGASFVDDAAFTVGTSSGAPVMGMLDDSVPDTVDEGDVGTVRMSSNRNLYVRIRDNAGNERGLNIDANGELGISAIRSALPAGTNAIGKLSANSGVDIGDVDVTSVPTDPFGANADAASATGSISAKLRFIASTGIPVTGTVTVGSHAVTNAGTFATQVDGAALTALQLIDDDQTGASLHHRISVGTTEDKHEVKGSAGRLFSINVTNTNAAARYLRCSNQVTGSTTPGTTTVFYGMAIPGNTAGAGFTTNFGPSGIAFSTGLTCWLVTGAAETDVAEVAANEINVNYIYK